MGLNLQGKVELKLMNQRNDSIVVILKVTDKTVFVLYIIDDNYLCQN